MAVVRLTRPLSGEVGAEARDCVVITDGGGGEDEVEVGLVDVRRAELGLGVPGGALRVLSSAGRQTDERHSSGAFWCGLSVD
jgi:hypothetical protein